jgi:hypothetical protein
VRQQRDKETKNDTAIELAALLHEVRECGSRLCVVQHMGRHVHVYVPQHA